MNDLGNACAYAMTATLAVTIAAALLFGAALGLGIAWMVNWL